MESEVHNFSFIFFRYLSILKRNLKVILTFSIIGVLLGVTFSSIKKTRYKSSFSLFLDSGSGSGLNQYLGLAESFGFDLGGGGGSMTPENIAELAVSKKIIYKTLFSQVNDDGINKLYVNLYLDSIGLPQLEPKEIYNETFRIVSNNEDSLSLYESKLINEIYLEIKRKRLSVDISNKTSVIKHNVSMNNEEVTYQFSRLFINAVKSFYEKRTSEKKLSIISILTNKSDSIKSILLVKEEQLASLSDQNNFVVRKKYRLDELRLAREIEILNTMYAINIKNLEIAKFTHQETNDVLNVLDRPMLPLEEKSANPIIYGGIGGTLFFTIILTFLLISSKLKNDLKKLDQINA